MCSFVEGGQPSVPLVPGAGVVVEEDHVIRWAGRDFWSNEGMINFAISILEGKKSLSLCPYY